MNYAVICIDETGSMAGQEERVVTSMNEYVNSLPDDAHVTVFKFDSNHWTKFYDDYKTAWQKMEPANYSPGAMTPLYDAIGKTVRHAESLASDGDKVLVMVDTDGHENASKEHTVDSVNAVVDAKKTAGWEFLFMAGGINEAQAQQVGAIGQALGMTTNMASPREAVSELPGCPWPDSLLLQLPLPGDFSRLGPRSEATVGEGGGQGHRALLRSGQRVDRCSPALTKTSVPLPFPSGRSGSATCTPSTRRIP